MKDSTQNETDSRQRPSINVQMDCCGTYCRIYLNVARTAYAGHCPRCASPVRIRVAEDGSSSKFFRVS